MGTPIIITRELIEELTPTSKGVMANIAKNIGVSRQAVKQFLDKDENKDLKEKILEARQVVIDVAENKLFEQVEAGEQWAVKYVLSTIGKKRGYVERQELAGVVDEPITIVYKRKEDTNED